MTDEQFPPRIPGKLNIYMHVSENSGVGYFRQYLQALKLREHKLANVLISDFRWGEGNHMEPTTSFLFQIANWADVIVIGRRDMGEFYAQWGGIREFFNMPIILDTDDNVHFVRPSNPGYQGYRPGSEAMTWNTYAIEKVFDAITVTTEELRDFYKKKNPKIYVLPNSLDFMEWDKHEKKQWNDDLVRIAFIGSGAHSEGVRIIKDPMIKIMQKHPNVLFLITHIYKWMFNDAPEDIQKRIQPVPWIKLQDFQKEVKALGIDIGLAPLADNMFNRAKSNLRWLEYSAAKMAPIVSPVRAYSCVRNWKDGIVAKEKQEWFDAIDRLICDVKLRERIANEAYRRVSTEFNIDRNIGLWEKVYREVHDKFHQYFGPKKIFEPLGKGKYRQLKK